MMILPEQAFFMVGTIDDALEKAKKMEGIIMGFMLEIVTPDREFSLMKWIWLSLKELKGTFSRFKE